ncbi:MAG: hypothetical protein JNM56_09610 [Planctomycetia bacterium]|nr:hypothetical protein [Planctomycetia bacterium]
MQCYTCGSEIPADRRICPACGRARSWLIYVPFFGVIGGIIGSLIGFTLRDTAWALIGGLLGIVLAETGARLLLRPRRSAG